MQLFVRAQEAHLVEFGEAATVADVKAFVSQAEGIPAGEQVICYAGVPLEDAEALSGFNALAALDVTARLVGGKVHGSLSRAGKVKNQTPKVAKGEDKKKQPRGRAKRRKQYSKRFIAAAAKFGKKKGPNSNS